MRSADLVARIGGDEFVIVHEMNDPSWRDLVQRIERALSSPIDISDTEAVFCSASIGHADTQTVESTSGALLAAADAAMYQKKRIRSLPVATSGAAQAAAAVWR